MVLYTVKLALTATPQWRTLPHNGHVHSPYEISVTLMIARARFFETIARLFCKHRTVVYCKGMKVKVVIVDGF